MHSYFVLFFLVSDFLLLCSRRFQARPRTPPPPPPPKPPTPEPGTAMAVVPLPQVPMWDLLVTWSLYSGNLTLKGLRIYMYSGFASTLPHCIWPSKSNICKPRKNDQSHHWDSNDLIWKVKCSVFVWTPNANKLVSLADSKFSFITDKIPDLLLPSLLNEIQKSGKIK